MHVDTSISTWSTLWAHEKGKEKVEWEEGAGEGEEEGKEGRERERRRKGREVHDESTASMR